jgi:hypothetical protein
MQESISTTVRYLLLLAFCLIFVNVFAAWLNNVPGKVSQPDGTVIDVLKSGDEFHNWAHDENGYTIVKDKKTGFWCWAKSAQDGDIESSGYPVHLYTPESLNLTPRVNISAARYQEKRQPFDTRMRS